MFGITFKSKTLAFSFKGDLCRGKDTASWLGLGEKSEKEKRGFRMFSGSKRLNYFSNDFSKPNYYLTKLNGKPINYTKQIYFSYHNCQN